MSRGLQAGVAVNLSVCGVGAGLPAWESIWWDIWSSAEAGGQASYPTQMSGAASSERDVEELLTSGKVEAKKSTFKIGRYPLQQEEQSPSGIFRKIFPQFAAGKLNQNCSVAEVLS